MARFTAMSHRAPLAGPPRKAVWIPNRTVWRPLGGPSTPHRDASAAIAVPSLAVPLGLEVPLPHPLHHLLPEHNLLAKRDRDPPTSLARQQCLKNRRRRVVASYFHGEGVAPHRQRRAMLQRVQRRVHTRIIVVETRVRLCPDSLQVLTEASVPGEHLRHSVG